MGFYGLANLLTVSGIFLILYFSFSSSKEEGKFNFGEFVKLAGILILLSIVLVAFMATAFLVIRAFSWALSNVFSFFQNSVFTNKAGYLFSLLLVNAGGAYMLWERLKEDKEEVPYQVAETPAQPATPPPVAPPEVKEEAAPVEEVKVELEVPIKEETSQPDSKEEDSEKKSEAEKVEEEATEVEKTLGLAGRIAKSLGEAGINTIDQLTAVSEQELKEKKNIGDKSLDEIKSALEKKGLSLKPS